MDEKHPSLGTRIHVVGTSGSGKTTLASRIAGLLEIPHVELDALHWGPDWAMPELEAFREKVAEAVKGEAWVVDGNYSKVRDIVWAKADTVIWLDYSLPLVFWRVLWRTLRRSLTGEELWNGNRESMKDALFSKDSVLWYSVKSFKRLRRRYSVLFLQPEFGHIRFMRLFSPGEERELL